MSLTANQHRYLRQYVAGDMGSTAWPWQLTKEAVAAALAEVDRLQAENDTLRANLDRADSIHRDALRRWSEAQATATRRGELLERAQTALSDLRFNNGPSLRQEAHNVMAAITAELADGEGT